MIPAFSAKVDTTGSLILDNEEAFTRYLRAAFSDGEVIVTVRRSPKIRSASQNRYYHGVVIRTLSEHLGYTNPEMHHLIKSMFHIESTTKLETSEFERLLEDIRAWAQVDLDVSIPLPHEIVV